jgi:hypothetical protein
MGTPQGAQVEYFLGVALAIAVAGLAAMVGFDRERAFYPTVLIVIASYYVLFAAMGSKTMAASRRTLELEIAAATVFLLLAVVGFKRSSWLVVAALAGHGVFDFVHHFFIENSGVPHWWPGFCLAFDVTLAVWLAIRPGKPGAGRPAA